MHAWIRLVPSPIPTLQEAPQVNDIEMMLKRGKEHCFIVLSQSLKLSF